MAEENQPGKLLQGGQNVTLPIFPASLCPPQWHPPEVASQPLYLSIFEDRGLLTFEAIS